MEKVRCLIVKDEEILESYEDEKGEYVLLENPKTGKLEKRYVRDLVIEAFGNADEYDKLREEKLKNTVTDNEQNS